MMEPPWRTVPFWLDIVAIVLALIAIALVLL
jgi:hypothetical protein